MAVASGRRVDLGALQPDTARSILVFSDDGELAVALRERIEPHQALIRDVRSAEAQAAIAACRPFPWMVVGEGTPPGEVLSAARSLPILVFWRAPCPPELPRHTAGFRHFSQLREALDAALTRTVGGLRLARGEGLEMPDGTHVSSAHLQGLLGAYPYGFDLPVRSFRSAASLLARHGVRAQIVRDGPREETVLR